MNIFLLFSIIPLFPIVVSSTSSLINYRFAYNFGSIFHDYSNNANDAVNGDSSTTTLYDTIPTDRGAFFPTGDSRILMPPNDQATNPLLLPPTFTILFWSLLTSDNPSYTIYRYLDSSHFFYLRRDQTNSKFIFRVVQSSTDSTELSGYQYNYPTGIIYSGSWVFVMLTFDSSHTFSIISNVFTEITYSLDYSESSGSYFFWMGFPYNDIGLEGFIWEIIILSGVGQKSDYFGSVGANSCLDYIPCGFPCSFAFVDNGVTGCVSSNTNYLQNSNGNTCGCGAVGCIGSVCLVCTATYNSCVISGGAVVPWCPTGSSVSGNTCACTTGTFDGSACVGCDAECSTCSSSTLCTACTATYAVPDTALCKCTTGYYGSHPLASAGSCVKCGSECATCDNTSGDCHSCVADFATVSGTGCLCNSGYYGVHPLSTQTSCLSCSSECATCDTSGNCLTCTAAHATVSGTGCNCSSGYYGSHPLHSAGSCVGCSAECVGCDSSSGNCQACVAANASPAGTVCACNGGYSGTAPLSSAGSCSPCSSDCSACEAAGCVTCLDPNAVPSASGCVCRAGYYGTPPLVTHFCRQCFEDCLTCSGPLLCEACKDSEAAPSLVQGCECVNGYYQNNTQCLQCAGTCKTCTNSTACTSCKYQGANLDVVGNCTCPEFSVVSGEECGCIGGYYQTGNSNGGYVCEQCVFPCSKCVSEDICVDCQGLLVVSGTEGRCNSCEEGYYFVNYECFVCQGLCSTCRSAEECIECVEHADGPPVCLCDEGYYQSGSSCQRRYFIANMTVLANNTVQLLFNESLASGLSLSDFTITIPQVIFIPNLYNSSDSLYVVTLQFSTSVADNTQISINFTQSLISTNGSAFQNYELIGYLHEYAVPYTNANLQSVSNATATVVASIVSTAVFSGLISNPSNLWTLLNTLQIISYIPLSSIPLPPNLQTFFQGTSGLNIVTNPMFLVITSKNTGQPYLEASQYGFTTSLFVLNAGVYITNLLCFLVLIPMFYLLSKIRIAAVAMKAAKILDNYRYCFFLRYWIQGYLDLGVFAIVQLKSVIFR